MKSPGALHKLPSDAKLSAELAALIPPGAEPILAIRYVVGEVHPVFDDAAALRAAVFTGEHQAPAELERDAWESVSLHFVAYLDVTASRHYHELRKQREKMRSVIQGTSANPTHNTNNNNNNNNSSQPRQPKIKSKQEKDVLQPPAHANTSKAAAAATKPTIKFTSLSPEDVERLQGLSYRQRKLVPVGAVRLRRVNRTAELGDFTMMVAKLDWLCVLKDFREYKIGALLVEEAELVARHAFHVPFVVVHAPVGTKGFYKKIGFEVKTDTFTEGGIERVGMVKSLLTSKGPNKREADDCVVLDAKGRSKPVVCHNTTISFNANKNDKASGSTTPSKL